MDGNHFTDNTDDRREVYRRGYVEKLRSPTRHPVHGPAHHQRSDEPTIIIVHGDHGGGLHLDHNSPATAA